MELFKATAADITAVAAIYGAVKKGQYCVWDEEYPTEKHAAEDQAAGCLYVLKLNGEIIGCVSVEPIAEDDDLPFWRINDGTHREISRIAISPGYQGNGYAGKMVEMLVNRLVGEGASSIHLLAAKSNCPAVSIYRSLGFDFIGECHRYGHDYFVCEKVLNV